MHIINLRIMRTREIQNTPSTAKTRSSPYFKYEIQNTNEVKKKVNDFQTPSIRYTLRRARKEI